MILSIDEASYDYSSMGLCWNELVESCDGVSVSFVADCNDEDTANVQSYVQHMDSDMVYIAGYHTQLNLSAFCSHK